MQRYTRRCWVEIDYDSLSSNMNLILSRLDESEKPMAVVKADAYGCGSQCVSKFLQKNFKIENWVVASLEEAVGLREAGIEGEILVLGYTFPENANVLAKYNISQSVFCKEYAVALSENLAKIGQSISIHIAIDTGMNRVGFLPSDDFMKYAKLPGFKLSGIFTHLCCADSLSDGDVKFTSDQIEKFRLSASTIKNAHCKNSAAILRKVGNGFSLVRPGIILYGLQPSNEVKCEELRPVMSFRATVSMVKTIQKGETIGYGRTFCADSERKIATVSVGYADGYSRRLSNKGKVLINGKVASVVGNVCMDHIMIDVTGIDVKAGDVVTLFGSDGQHIISADDVAELIGTIGYEVMCNVSKRVPRLYINDK